MAYSEETAAGVPAGGDKPTAATGPAKEVITTKVTVTVAKWANVKSGYGFINRSDTKEDVFVHQSAIVRNNPRKLVHSVGDGEEVEFDVVVGEKGKVVATVTGRAEFTRPNYGECAVYGSMLLAKPYKERNSRTLRREKLEFRRVEASIYRLYCANLWKKCKHGDYKHFALKCHVRTNCNGIMDVAAELCEKGVSNRIRVERIDDLNLNSEESKNK